MKNSIRYLPRIIFFNSASQKPKSISRAGVKNMMESFREFYDSIYFEGYINNLEKTDYNAFCNLFDEYCTEVISLKSGQMIDTLEVSES